MATFNININGATIPVANNKSYNILPNTTTIFKVEDTDFLGTTPTILTIEIDVTHGTTAIIGNTVQYTPTNGYVGADSFYYKITDNKSNSDIAKVNIQIG